MARRKISAAIADLHSELARLEQLDAENQARFSSLSVKGQRLKLSKRQLHLSTEAIFFAAFRAYESFLRDIFLLYCLETRPHSRAKVRSYLRPKNFAHAETLIQASTRFLDWTSPEIIIRRAELYLEDGFPIKLPYTTHRETLSDFKRIRNHIAHNSKESLAEYQKVLEKHYRTIPLAIPSPGEFLLVSEKKDPTKYKLLTFFSLLRKISIDLT